MDAVAPRDAIDPLKGIDPFEAIDRDGFVVVPGVLSAGAARPSIQATWRRPGSG